MNMISGLALVLALAASSVDAQQVLPQNLPMPAAETPGLPAPQDAAYPGIIQLHVDTTDLDRHIIAIHEVIPVKAAGPLTLLVPK